MKLKVIAAICLIAGIGGLIWYGSHRNQQPKAPQKDGEWTIVTEKTVSLPVFHVTATFPKKLVGKAVYKGPNIGGGYDFSLRSIIDNPKCVAYFAGTNNIPGISLYKYQSNFNAASIFGSSANSTETLNDYYTKHKSKSGNYVPDNASRDWYKIGNDFYVFFSDPPEYQQQQATEQAKACPNVDPDWQQEFKNLVPGIKAS